MEQHDGGIEITTEENVGTSVILWLPVYVNINTVDVMVS